MERTVIDEINYTISIEALIESQQLLYYGQNRTKINSFEKCRNGSVIYLTHRTTHVLFVCLSKCVEEHTHDNHQKSDAT